LSYPPRNLPKGDVNSNPNLCGIVEILCENDYKVDICSIKKKEVAQNPPCPGAKMLLLDRDGVHSEDGFFILAGQSLGSSEMIASYLDKNFDNYDLVVGVDRGIVEAAIIARIKKVPCGLISYEIFFEEEAGAEFKNPEIQACRNIDFAVCQDPVRAGCLSKQNGIPMEKIITIPVAGRGIKQGPKDTYFHDTLEIEKGNKIALFTGHFAGWTMIDSLAESARNWQRDWAMVLHSKGGLDGAARPYCEKYKSYNNTFFSLQPEASINQMDRILHSADVGIAFYQPDGGILTGNNIKYIGMASGKISTYLQHGLPVIVNEIGQMSDFVRDYKLGSVVNNEQCFDVSLTDTELLQYKQNCYEFFKSHLDLNKTIKPLLEKVRKLTCKSPVSDVCLEVQGSGPKETSVSANVNSTKPKLPSNVDVSIVVATKDRGKLLENMLTSLKEAAGDINYEVIAVEGNSSDDTLDVLSRHGVTQVYNETESLGPGRHSWPQLYNFGFSKARGKWAMYASDDIVFSEGCLAKAVDTLKRQKSPSVAGGVFFYKEIIPDNPGWDRPGICFALGHKLLMNYGLIRLDVFNELNGLDEGYKFYSADIDLTFKVYKSQRQLIPLPDGLLIHDNVQDSLKEKNKITEKADNQYLMQKWGDYVPPTLPLPNRLYQDPLYTKAFMMPQELTNIDSGLEHFWRGVASFQLSKISEAIQQFSHTLNSSCKHWTVLWLAAEALYRSGHSSQAEKAAGFALELNPDSKEVQLLLETIKGSNAVSTPSHSRQNINNVQAKQDERTLILQIKYGGLGDHLFYSHLPRVAKETGQYDKVYISNHSAFSNDAYRHLIWGLNPYVDGFCDEPGYRYEEFSTVEPGMNILDNVMLREGLDDGKRFHEPELYFKPKYRQDLSEAVVYDPNFVSFVGDVSNEEVERFIHENGIHVTHQMKLWDKNFYIRNFDKILHTPSIEEFCSVVVSCKQLVCLSSGTATLAAALGRAAIVVYGDGQKKMFHHSRFHKYINCSAKPVASKLFTAGIGAGVI